MPPVGAPEVSVFFSEVSEVPEVSEETTYGVSSITMVLGVFIAFLLLINALLIGYILWQRRRGVSVYQY